MLSNEEINRQLVIGTFTHRQTYFPALQESIKKFYPEIPFIVQQSENSAICNFELLRQKFLQTSRRYWLFMDDDTEFIEPVLEKVFQAFDNPDCALIGTLSTNNKERRVITKKDAATKTNVVLGHFQLVDSYKVGFISLIDDNSPYRLSQDLDYSLRIFSAGYDSYIVPVSVYHVGEEKYEDMSEHPELKGINTLEDVACKYNYLLERWGDVYNRCFFPALT